MRARRKRGVYVAPYVSPYRPPRGRPRPLSDVEALILAVVKRLGMVTVRQVATETGLAENTVSSNLNALESEALVFVAVDAVGVPRNAQTPRNTPAVWSYT